MIKFLTQKINPSKISISKNISLPHKEQLMQAQKVMDNYLKDKNCNIKIRNSAMYGNDYLDVQAMSNSKKTMCLISVLKDGDVPFLRKIYKAIETVANNVK